MNKKLLLLLFLLSGGITTLFAQQIPGASKDATPLLQNERQDIFVPAQKKSFKAATDFIYETATYTFSDLLVFSYFDDSQFIITNVSNDTIVNDTLDNNEYLISSNSEGIYYIACNNPFTLLIGDPVTRSVMGYFSVDESGKGVSTRLSSYIPSYQYNGEHFIVFAYHDNTEYAITNLETDQLIKIGVLNAGEHVELNGFSSTFVGVTASKPVSALSYTDQGYYIPSSNGSFAGQLFYGFSGYVGGWANSMNITAYEDNTEFILLQNTTEGLVDTLATDTLNMGEVFSHTVYMDTYWTVKTNKNVTVSNTPYGAFSGSYYYMTRQIDESGTGIGTNFYVPTISGDVNLFSFEDDNLVTISQNNGADTIFHDTLQSGENHYFYSSKEVYHATSTKNISIITSNGGSFGADFMPLSFSASLPDLAVSANDMEVDVTTGDETIVQVNTTVQNFGSIDADQVKVRFYLGDPEAKNPISDVIEKNIPAGSSTEFMTTFTEPENAEYQEIYVIVDIENEIIESNESNNISFKFIIPNEDLLPPLAVSLFDPPFIDEETIDTSAFNIDFFLLNTWDVTISGIWALLEVEQKEVFKSATINDSIYIGNLAVGENFEKSWLVEISDEYEKSIIFYALTVGSSDSIVKKVKRMIPYEGDNLFSAIQNTNTNEFELFPNPAKDQITATLINGYFTNSSIEIYNDKGILVKNYLPTIHSKSIRINTSDMYSGVYFIRIRTAEGKSLVKKVIITD